MTDGGIDFLLEVNRCPVINVELDVLLLCIHWEKITSLDMVAITSCIITVHFTYMLNMESSIQMHALSEHEKQLAQWAVTVQFDLCWLRGWLRCKFSAADISHTYSNRFDKIWTLQNLAMWTGIRASSVHFILWECVTSLLWIIILLGYISVAFQSAIQGTLSGVWCRVASISTGQVPFLFLDGHWRCFLADEISCLFVRTTYPVKSKHKIAKYRWMATYFTQADLHWLELQLDPGLILHGHSS